MLLVITVALVTLAALNAILTAWATMLDARHASALMRALGAKLSPGQRSQYGHCAGWVGPRTPNPPPSPDPPLKPTGKCGETDKRDAWRL